MDVIWGSTCRYYAKELKNAFTTMEAQLVSLQLTKEFEESRIVRIYRVHEYIY